MKLEKGMYVRTKYGIAKIIGNNFSNEDVENILVVDKILEFGFIGEQDELLCDKKDILKVSHNIIDLIEEHDIIKHDILKTMEVKEIDKENGIICFYNLSWKLNIKDFQKAFKSGTIKILTHEQFENNCYMNGD